MKLPHVLLLASVLVLPLAGCNPHGEAAGERTGQLNLDILGKSYTLTAPGVPRATVSPDGELKIRGEAVALTPHQRDLVRAYHAEVGGIAGDGIEIGKQGLGLAGKAIREAIRGILDGDPQSVGPNIEADAHQVKTLASRLCDRLVRLRTAQDALAAAVPEFVPYANLTKADIDQCRAGVREAAEEPAGTPPEAVPEDAPPSLPAADSTRA